jgi:membrane protease YdiL (CAAX protease family)
MPTDVHLPQIIAGLTSFAIMIAGIAADCIIITAIEKRKIRWNESLTCLRNRPWFYYDGIYIMLVLATVFTAMILGMSIIDKCGITLAENTKKITVLAETLFMHLIIIGSIENLRRKKQCSYRDLFSIPKLSLKKSAKQGLMFYCAIIPPIVIVATLVNMLLKHFNIPVEPQEIMKDFIDPNAPLWLSAALAVIAVIFAPIIEEITFRGILLPIAVKHTKPLFAIITVSLLFALIHMNLQAIAPLFVLAVGLSLSYIYSRTIIVPMLIHSIFNTISLGLYLLASS